MSKKLKNLKRLSFKKEKIKVLRQSPGIYIFFNVQDAPLYIGKAIKLKSRVSSYLLNGLAGKTYKMIKDTKKLSVIYVNSELEALLLESRLIKENKPKYNVSLRDDKNPLYIRITDEQYPRILTARKINEKIQPAGGNRAFYGPFPSSGNVRSVLHLIRRIFPYSQHKLGKKRCIYGQMGLCNPCPNETEKLKDEKTRKREKEKYLQNIKYIKGVLDGRFTFVKKSLNRLMKQYSKDENFEMAALVRDQIEKLDYVTQPLTSINLFISNPNLIEDIRNEESRYLRKLLLKSIKLPKTLRRIEGFDVAHLAGSSPTASMVTFIDGEPDKSLYRHFKIRQRKGKSDTDSLREVARRRVKYLSSWGKPDLIIVDGGRAQVSVFRKVLKEFRIPVVGLSKRRESLVIPVKNKKLKTHGFIERVVPRGPARNLVQRIRDEAHRFARRYHHKLLKRELIPT